MWEFKKNKERIVISMDEKVIYSQLEVNLEEEQEEYLFNISTLSIFFYSTSNSQDDINKLAKKSVESFFNFWIKKKGWKEFISHMLELGFTLKKINKTNQQMKDKVYKSELSKGTTIFSEPLPLKYLNT